MDSESEELSVLMRMKKKRRLSSEDKLEDVNKMTGSTPLATFVQSALKHTPKDVSEREKKGDQKSMPRGSSSRKKQLLASRELQRRLEAVRFPGYSGDEEEEERLSAIEVFSESESEGNQNSDHVERYTHKEGEGGGREEGDEGVMREGERRGLEWPPPKRRRRMRRKQGKRQRCREIQAGAENIQDFDSLSSESSESSVIPPSPPPQLHTSTPSHPRRSMTIRDFPNLAYTNPITTSSLEYMNIATPPSSPELTATTYEQPFSKTTTGAWIKQISVESPGNVTNNTTHCLNDTVLRALGNTSEGGRKGKGRRGRMVPGGLAEAVERVAQRESSEIIFWEHRARKIEDYDIDLTACLTVEIFSLINSHSLKVAKCRVIAEQQPPLQSDNSNNVHREQGSGSSQESHAKCIDLGCVDIALSSCNIEHGGSGRDEVEEREGDRVTCGGLEEHVVGEGGGEVVTVLFSTRCAKFLNLQAGCHVRIHPPWQSLTMPPLQHKVILCTHFCQLLTIHTPRHLPTPLPTPSHCHKGVEGVRTLHSPHKSPTSHHPILIKSANQLAMVPSRLFPAPPVLGYNSTRMVTSVHSASGDTGDAGEAHVLFTDAISPTTLHPPYTTGTATTSGSTSSDVCCTLLDAMEDACRGVLSLACRVLRVYRRAVYTAGTLFSCAGGGSGTRECKRAPQPSQYNRWCVLVCDASSMFCEVQISDSSLSTWNEVVTGGEGRVYVFRNIRVSRRTNPTRNPELFSLIRYLCSQLSSPHHITAHAGCGRQSPTSDEGATHSAPDPIPIPSFCYILVSGPEAVPIPDQGKDSNFPTLNTTLNALPTNNHYLDHNCEISRGTIYARVVHYRAENPPSIRSCGPSTHHHHHALTPHYGHFLFVVTSSHSPPSQSPTHFSSLDPPYLLCLYIKPYFPREGLEQLLCSPGQRLMIRDVELKSEKGCTQYSVDSCSVVYPLANTAVPPNMLYPKYNFSADEESVMQNLPPPTLPPLTSHHRVGTIVSLSGIIVGIDEETAFSWPECNRCGNEKLSSTYSSTREELYCDECQESVPSPSIHLQLAVYIQPSPPSTFTLCVQLLQSTIRTLLSVSSDSIDEPFDVESVLRQSVYLHGCYVQEIRETESGGGGVLYLQEICIGR